jgi:hypothetical protein
MHFFIVLNLVGGAGGQDHDGRPTNQFHFIVLNLVRVRSSNMERFVEYGLLRSFRSSELCLTVQ